jgi:hypothetical protein
MIHIISFFSHLQPSNFSAVLHSLLFEPAIPARMTELGEVIGPRDAHGYAWISAQHGGKEVQWLWLGGSGRVAVAGWLWLGGSGRVVVAIGCLIVALLGCEMGGRRMIRDNSGVFTSADA